MTTDIVIIGSGCAGLYCALHLPKERKITIITKSNVEESDSFLAQGGMCTLREPSDYELFFEDTLKAGHYENDKKSVEIMIQSSPGVVRELISYGTDFQKDENGELLFTSSGWKAFAKSLTFPQNPTVLILVYVLNFLPRFSRILPTSYMKVKSYTELKNSKTL